VALFLPRLDTRNAMAAFLAGCGRSGLAHQAMSGPARIYLSAPDCPNVAATAKRYAEWLMRQDRLTPPVNRE